MPRKQAIWLVVYSAHITMKKIEQEKQTIKYFEREEFKLLLDIAKEI
ncbi:hypothetical protein IEU_00178 [Bacillus mycoides]|nr:hypothetical protein IEY_05151 [Bacillus mycoides]EJQ68429.1 hypothetical protein IEW_00178 [Bacillus mycoides]EJV73235.1 hypothetical protein IEU_00178 [Bacillus mycoides]